MPLSSSTVGFLRKIVHGLGLLPIIYMGWLAVSGGFAPGRVFGLCGLTALSFLILTLCVSPAAKLSNTPLLIKLRRPCGLWSFAWAAGHAGIFLIIFMHLDVGRIVQAVQHRPFIALGQGAFLILLTLALTSSRRAMNALGRNWRRLHRLIYLAVLLASAHFWLAESESPLPKAAAVLAVLLLLFRLRGAFSKPV